MEILFAPMEGVTYPEYRRLHAEMFPGITAYYAPFLAPSGEGNFKPEYLKKVLPDAERGIPLVPQLLANNPAAFCDTVRKLRELGYGEINLNAGCPSGTVVAKHKGAGMLSDPDSLDRFLGEVFSACGEISVKTRLGVNSCEEFDRILPIYNAYPMPKLIIHARDRSGMYRSRPDVDRFCAAAAQSSNPVVYNGDVFSPEDVACLQQKLPEFSGIMVGRGAVANPALPRMIQGGPALETDELRTFHDRLLDAYLSGGLSPNYAAERMKNLWAYMGCLFPDSAKRLKGIRKARTLADYRSAVSLLFSERFDGSAAYPGE